MGSYIKQREKYLSKVIRLSHDGMRPSRISRIIPVPENTIRGWIIKFAPENQNTQVAMKTRKQQSSSVSTSESEDVKALKKRVKELETKLLNAEIKAEAYDEMINVAEAMFNIPIRKKAGAKQ